MRVALCLATYRYPKPAFVASFAGLLTHTLSREVVYNGSAVIPSVDTLFVEGKPIDIAREELAVLAVKNGYDYALFFDDDMTFPVDSLFRLAVHDKPIVGCNYPRRQDGAIISSASNRVKPGRYGWRAIEPKKLGLEPVDVLGFGVCLVKTAVFRAIPPPWFMGGTDEADANFCERAKAHGIQSYVDHSLSMEVGHIAETILTFPR